MIACAVTDLPEPGLAQDRDRLPSFQRERHAVDGTSDPVASRELDLQFVDLEEHAPP